jgi:receptor protein-tyrosine kinase
MSLIEKAVQRLEQLQSAQGVAPADSSASERTPEVVEVLATAPAKPAPQDEGGRSQPIGIDLARLSAMGMVSPESPRSGVAEEYRVIKRPLLKNVSDGSNVAGANSNLIMVTSSLPGEGKSFTAINLAISIAMELDRTVLLVDADVSKPSVLKVLGLPPRRGLMDVLAEGNYDLSEVMLRTNIPKLSILPAGMPHERATEFLASESMNRLLAEISTRYADRVVIFDSPPLIPTTEARVLATHMGQIVMVVEAGRTTNGALRQALSTIEACPIKLMVLNKARDGGPGGYYGYGYGYGYGHEAQADAA